jgi:putative copper resistance protein D
MHTLYIISVYVHILSAAVWVGGMFFLILVLIPVLRKPELRESFPAVFYQAGVRFRLVGWVSLALLIVTGTFNLAFRGFTISDLLTGRIFEGSFGHTLLSKLIAVGLILIVSVIHDFWIGPKAGEIIREDPFSPRGRSLRRMAVMLGRLNFFLALLVVLLAVMLVRGGV